jgi:hypothetical protein
MRPIVVLFSLLFAIQLSAQPLRVSVRDANEPLPYANIYLNGTYLMSADLDGVAQIKEGSLKVGDVISSSYLGYAPASVVYDEAIRATGLCTLVHEKEQVYEVEEVVVAGGGMNGWDAFQKYVNPKETPRGRYVVNGDFAAQIRLPDNTVRTISGDFLLSDQNYQRDITTTLVKLNTLSDTTAISRKLTHDVSFAVMSANGFVRRLNYIHNSPRERKNPYRTLIYLGLRDGKRHFTFTYISPEIEGTNQAFLQVDGESKFVESIYFTSTALQGFDSMVYSSTILFEHYKPESKGAVRTKPTKIEIDFRPNKNGLKTDMALSNLTIEMAK